MNENSSAKAKEFRKVLRGYDPAEVSAYIDSLKKQLGASRRKEQELEDKLKAVMIRYDEVDTKGEELEEALANIEAQRRSAAMLDETRKRCAEAEREMREGISRQRDAFVSMHEMILSFRSDLFEKYNAQIESIDSIASLADAYDEAMMYCMKKNGVSADTEAADEDKSAEAAYGANEADNGAEAPEGTAGESDEGAAPDASITESGLDREENIPDAEDEALADTAEGEDSERVSDDASATDESDSAPSFDFFTDSGDAPSEDKYPIDEDDFYPAEDDGGDEDYSPVDGKYIAEDYSFDENSVPHASGTVVERAEPMSDADRIIAEETPRVTRDDLPKDFDIYHASGDQLLELIYGKKTSSADSGENDPLHGVDYTFGDD
jgi:DivIVA domain-containing protein